jgi:hypothetical protein
MNILPKNRAPRLAVRLILIVVVAYTLGSITNRAIRATDRSNTAPGFVAGIAHGALMPGAMLSLAFGRDIVIYSARNSGRLYNLGYTFGVNACGALFFGMFYWRLSRLNRWRKEYGS